MSGIRSTSVGADLGHWKAYASKNNTPSKGATGESPGVKLATPTTKKATGGAVKKRADRFARGGRTKDKRYLDPFDPRYPDSSVRMEEQRRAARSIDKQASELMKKGEAEGKYDSFGGRKLPDEEYEKRGGRAKRATGGRLTAGACTGEGREEKAALHKRAAGGRTMARGGMTEGSEKRLKEIQDVAPANRKLLSEGRARAARGESRKRDDRPAYMWSWPEDIGT